MLGRRADDRRGTMMKAPRYMRLSIVAIAALICLPARAAAQLLTVPVPIADPSSFVGAWEAQDQASIASDGDGWLAAWLDNRTVKSHVVFTRISPSGEVLDPGGVFLSASDVGPRVVWDGNEYIVVSSGRIARVRADGSLVEPVRAVSTPGFSENSTAAWTGRVLLLVSPGYDEVTAATFTAAGDLISEHSLRREIRPTARIVSTSLGQSGAAIAWEDSKNTTILFFDVNGLLVKEAHLGHGVVSIASNGRTTLAALVGSNSIAVIELDPASGLSRLIGITRVGFMPIDIRLSAAGNGYELLTLTPTGEVTVTALDSSGALAGNAIEIGSMEPNPNRMAMSGNSHAAFAVWTTQEASLPDISGRRLIAGRPAGEKTIVSNGLPAQVRARGAFNGVEALIAWSEPPAPGDAAAFYAGRIRSDGSHPDGRGALLTSTGVGGPSVASDGDGFVTLWVEAGGIVKTRHRNRDGAWSEPLIIAAHACTAGETNLAFGRDDFYAVWSDCSAEKSAIVGMRLDRRGTPIEGFSSRLPSVTGHEPVIAFNGDYYLVVWRDARTYDPWEHDQSIEAARVSLNGIPDASSIIVIPRRFGPHHLAVASDGHDFLIAWRDPYLPSLDLVRVTAEGNVLRASGFTELNATHPALIATAAGYRLATESTDGFFIRLWAYGIGAQLEHNLEFQGTASMYLLRADDLSWLLHPTFPFLDHTWGVQPTWPFLVAFGGRLLAGYSDFDAYADGTHTPRIFIRFFDTPQRGRAANR